MKSTKLFLKNLTLNNFATFENQSVEFANNLNAIIGETGSGKSLILDALQFLFGQRADKKLVRKGSSFATIEATFHANASEFKHYFDDIGFPFENNEVTLKRIIYNTGTSKSFLNFQSCPLSVLSNFSKRYIDIVGQFENQKLLNCEYQLKLLDSYAGSLDLRTEYETSYNRLKALKKEIEILEENYNILRAKEDYLEFQIKEISNLNPSVENEAGLVAEKDNLLQYEKNQGEAQELLYVLSDSDNNVISILKKLSRNSSDDLTSSRLEEICSQVEDLSYDISRKLEDNFNQERLNEVVDRLDHYQRLKRKFGNSVSEMLESLDAFKRELESINILDQGLKEKKDTLSDLENYARAVALKLHDIRKNSAKELSEKLTSVVQTLNMNGAMLVLEVSLATELSSSGLSKITFVAETNPGEGFFPVREIASGGELSRILLGLRQIISSTDSISVFLFDEIDTGIGGKTALKIGEALSKVSQHSQVITITHLPQIAHYAKRIISVDKKTENDRTYSEVNVCEGRAIQSFVKEMNPI